MLFIKLATAEFGVCICLVLYYFLDWSGIISYKSGTRLVAGKWIGEEMVKVEATFNYLTSL